MKEILGVYEIAVGIRERPLEFIGAVKVLPSFC
jgi:hypothetical protein